MGPDKSCLWSAFFKAVKVNLLGRQELLLAFREEKHALLPSCFGNKASIQKEVSAACEVHLTQETGFRLCGRQCYSSMEVKENTQCLHGRGLCSLRRASCSPSTTPCSAPLRWELLTLLWIQPLLESELQPCCACNQALIWVPAGLCYYTEGQYGHSDAQENPYEIHVDYF